MQPVLRKDADFIDFLENPNDVSEQPELHHSHAGSNVTGCLVCTYVCVHVCVYLCVHVRVRACVFSHFESHRQAIFNLLLSVCVPTSPCSSSPSPKTPRS